MLALVEEIERDVGPIEVAVFNVGANVPASILEETARKYFKIWEMACFGGFLMGREVARRMVPADGAPSSTPRHRLGPRTGAFRGLRGRQARAPSARPEHGQGAWPEGIHVAHVIIDGAIDGDFIRTSFRSSTRSRTRAASSIPPTSPISSGCCTPAARRLDVRARSASLDGER